MNILVISDEVSRPLYDNFDRSRLEGVDLILSCGDLPPQYLSFLATFTKVPVLYVHGNHDGCYKDTPPEGCICVEDMVYKFQGLKIAGLGGCMQYKKAPHQYTEKNMSRRVSRLLMRIFLNGGVDIFLTHAPLLDLGDCEDLPHKGFQCFYRILDGYKPKYMIHGHVHMNYERKPRTQQYKETMVINGFESYLFEYETGLGKGRYATRDILPKLQH